MRRLLLVVAAAVVPLTLAGLILAAQPNRRRAEADAAPLWERFAVLRVRESMVAADARWEAFLERPTLTAGLYRLPAGAEDRQQPHDRDEVYYVISGRATLSVDGNLTDVAPGTVVFVAAGVAHRFIDIEQPLEALVFFSNTEPE